MDGTPRSEVIEALRDLRTPNLRWPGGCFADGYHWQDGIGPREQRPRRVNQHWSAIESNAFGSAEFLALCESVGAAPYVVGNLGSGTVQEMRDWLEYLTHPGGTTLADLRAAHGNATPWAVRLWGVGNEAWGCGGDMDAATYAAEFRRYACFLSASPGAAPLIRVACGANGRDVGWTETIMRLCRKGTHHFAMEALSVHLYCSVRAEGVTGWEAPSEATWFTLMKKADTFGQALREHVAVMDRFDPERRVALYVDEWGVWYATKAPPASASDAPPPSPGGGAQGTGHEAMPATHPAGAGLLEQPPSLRDALVAALCIHRMMEHCERVQLANLAQAVNVLHAPLQTVKRPSAAHEGATSVTIVRTPTFHVLSMLMGHREASRLHVCATRTAPYTYGAEGVPRLSLVGTRCGRTGACHLSIVHTHPHAETTLSIELRGFGVSALRVRRATVLTGAMGAVAAERAPLRPEAAKLNGSTLRVAVPARSLTVVELAADADEPTVEVR